MDTKSSEETKVFPLQTNSRGVPPLLHSQGLLQVLVPSSTRPPYMDGYELGRRCWQVANPRPKCRVVSGGFSGVMTCDVTPLSRDTAPYGAKWRSRQPKRSSSASRCIQSLCHTRIPVPMSMSMSFELRSCLPCRCSPRRRPLMVMLIQHRSSRFTRDEASIKLHDALNPVS